jgi:hypothetical protein
MQLTTAQCHALLERFGVYTGECCDRCGQILGPVRFTRRGEAGAWCCRECRDGKAAHTPGTCKHCHAQLPKSKRRGAAFCDDACKQAAHRSKTAVQTSAARKISVTKPSIYAAFSQDYYRDGVAGRPGLRTSLLGDVAPMVNSAGVRVNENLEMAHQNSLQPRPGSTQDQAKRNRLLRAEDVAEITGLSVETLRSGEASEKADIWAERILGDPM